MSKTRSAAGHALETAGDAVHAAFDADVLAEHEHRRIGGEQLGEGAVDRFGERQRRPVLGQRAEVSPPASGRRGDGDAISDESGPPSSQRLDDFIGGGQSPAVDQLGRPCPHDGAGVEEASNDICRRRRPAG